MIRYFPLIEFKSPAWGNTEAFALGSDDLACGFFAQRLSFFKYVYIIIYWRQESPHYFPAVVDVYPALLGSGHRAALKVVPAFGPGLGACLHSADAGGIFL